MVIDSFARSLAAAALSKGGGGEPVDAYTKAQTDALLDEKADIATTYTKVRVDALLDEKVDVEAGKSLMLDSDKAKWDALTNTKTVTGNPASFDDGIADAPVGDLRVTMEPVQSGEGDPSPENVRPISRWDSVTVTREDGNGENTQTVTVSFPETVYGGTLDVTTGRLTVTQIGLVFDGTEAWKTSGNLDERTRFFYLVVTGSVTGGAANILPRACSHYRNAGVYTSSTSVGYLAYTSSGETWTRIQFRPNLDDIPDVTAWKAFLAAQFEVGTPVTCYWTPLTPKVYQLTPHQITTILGPNHISSSAGQVTVQYRGDIENLYRITSPSGISTTIERAPTLDVSGLDKADAILINDVSEGVVKRVPLINLLKWVHSMSYYTPGSVVQWASYDWIVFDVDYDNGYITLGLKTIYNLTRFSQDDDPNGSETATKYANSKLLSDNVVPFQADIFTCLYNNLQQLVRVDNIEGVGSEDDPMYVFIPTYTMIKDQFALSKVNRYSDWDNYGSHGNRITRVGKDGEVDLTNIQHMPHNRYWWWLSTAHNSSIVRYVSFTGGIGNSNTGNASNVGGFRPFVRIRA